MKLPSVCASSSLGVGVSALSRLWRAMSSASSAWVRSRVRIGVTVRVGVRVTVRVGVRIGPRVGVRIGPRVGVRDGVGVRVRVGFRIGMRSAELGVEVRTSRPESRMATKRLSRT
jgi:UDP-3-O-[3-hydroxymyristoyl] glucosamine N-acyltransferase